MLIHMKTIGFIGLGLIGGSIAKAIRKFHPDYNILAYAKHKETLAAALRQPGTKILMKSARRLPAVLAALKEQGLAGRSALVANCGLPGELALPRLDGPEGDAALDAGYFVTVIVKEG